MNATTRSFGGSPLLASAEPRVEPLRGRCLREVRSSGDLPLVRRETLTWSGGIGGRPLRVAFDAENPGDRPTRAVTAGIGVAAFGAFVPSRVVAQVAIPALAPGETARPTAVLRASDLPPTLVARPLLRRTPGIPSRTVGTPLSPGFSRLFLDLLGDRTTAWAGNLDVWMDERPRVERHCARLRCLARGTASRALAVVHTRPGDAVAFQATAPTGWDVQLDLAEGTVEAGRWYALRRGNLLVVSIRPPGDADARGEVVVHVRRRSDERVVPVEFQLVA
jgi:hypothetical protein